MIKIANPSITQADIEAVTNCLQEGQISGRSSICTQFERSFADKFGVQEAVAVNSGTSALFLAMKALGIGEGDEVIVPAYGFIAVPNAVRHAGATPVFVDVEEKTFNIDPSKITITPKIKAIIAVHTYGMPCDMDQLMAFGVPVIEDAAEAHGAQYKGKMVGSIGDIGCFSFFANKTITTGEGGMVVTDNPALAKEIRLLKDQYRGDIPYQHEAIGYGMSLSAIQCALGLSQLSRLDELLTRKREIAEKYSKELSHLLTKPREGDSKHSFWMYPVLCPSGLADHLKRFDIEIRPGFYPLHDQPPYQKGESFPVAEKIYKEVLCLPVSIDMTEEEQSFVIESINEYFSSVEAWQSFH